MSASTKRLAIHKSLLRVGTNHIDTKQTTSRLCPINRAPKGKTLYDTIAFLIFCPKHRNIAVCNTYHLNHGKAVWLPFIYLSNKVYPNDAIEDGLCLILSDYDSKLLFKYKEDIPFDTKLFVSLEVYFPKTNKYVHRINCLAILHNNGYQCCRKTSRIHWLSVEEICKSRLDQFWGPHVLDLCIRLKSDSNYFKMDHQLFQAPHLHLAEVYYLNYDIIYWEEYLLYSLGITRKQIDLLFIDFYEHCFPSLSMSFESFADYLSKYGFCETHNKLLRLYNAFKGRKSRDPYCTWPHLIFDNLLLGLAYIDKNSPHDRCRLRFVFQYYDQNRNGFLSEDEFREMVTNIHKNEGQEEIDRIVADGMTGNESQKGMNCDEFYNRTEIHEFGDATHLGKSDAQLLSDIYKAVKSRTTRPIDTLINIFKCNKK